MHLEAVTHKENILRGNNHQREKTHCPQGHEYSLDNTHYTPDNKRQCLICRREHGRKYKLNQKLMKRMMIDAI